MHYKTRRILPLAFFINFAFQGSAVAMSIGFEFDQRLGQRHERTLREVASKLCNIVTTPYPSRPSDQRYALQIRVSVKDIDGVGGTLAQAGPTQFVQLWNGKNVPTRGVLTIDKADLNNAGLKNILTHETMHVLGFGTLWEENNLLDTSSGAPYFMGRNASMAYSRLKGSKTLLAVPVENEGGSGTAGAHWSEKTFYHELMTGYYNEGIDNPLSRVSIGSLADVGHSVNYAAADPYYLPTYNTNARLALIGSDVPAFKYNRRPYHNCVHTNGLLSYLSCELGECSIL